MKKLFLLLLCPLFLCACAAPAVPAAPVSGECDEPTMTVALTFDDGPHPVHTPRLLDGLRDRDVQATFFLLGVQAEENQDLVRRMAAEGHQIGNHSYSHGDLETMTPWEAIQDFGRCENVLSALLGEGDFWVRPPYGNLTESERDALDAPIIKWSVDTEDWKSQDVDAILDIFYRDVCDGCIILMHDVYATSVDASLQAIDHLQAQGVRFVTVAELFVE